MNSGEIKCCVGSHGVKKKATNCNMSAVTRSVLYYIKDEKQRQ